MPAPNYGSPTSVNFRKILESRNYLPAIRLRQSRWQAEKLEIPDRRSGAMTPAPAVQIKSIKSVMGRDIC